MSNATVRMTIEFEINEEMLKEHGLTAEQVLKNIYLRDDDVCDGFQIGTIIEGFEPTSDFFLENGVVVEESLVKDALSLDEQISAASLKEYELTLFQGEENEQRIRARLTDEQVEFILKDISGVSNVSDTIILGDGTILGAGCIDAIEALDSDTLPPIRQLDQHNKER